MSSNTPTDLPADLDQRMARAIQALRQRSQELGDRLADLQSRGEQVDEAALEKLNDTYEAHLQRLRESLAKLRTAIDSDRASSLPKDPANAGGSSVLPLAPTQNPADSE